MAKGTPQHTGNPAIQTGAFPAKPDGTYSVNGIERWISKDPVGNPVFVNQNGQLVVKFAFQKADGSPDGPACAATPAEFWGIMRALGADISSIAPALRMTSESLTRAAGLAKTKSIEVTTRRGWVNGNRIPAAQPPEGKYMVRFVGAHRPDFKAGDYHFASIPIQTPQGQKTLFSLVFDFEIVGGPNGQPCLWDGYVLTDFFNDVFTDSYIDDEGKTVHAATLGRPLFGRDPHGAELPDILKWETFAKYFAPSLVDHDWQVNPLQSTYHVSEVSVPQYVYINLALQDNKQVLLPWRVKPKGQGMQIRWKDVPYENQLPVIDVTPEPPQPSVLLDLISFIEKQWPDPKLFDQSDPNSSAVVFTEAGRTWANQTLGGDNGIWARAGLTDHKRLDQLTEDELTRILNLFKADYSTSSDAQLW